LSAAKLEQSEEDTASPAGARRRNVGREESRALPAPSQTKAIVLAGGRGTRLAPYTSVLPKPLMPVGNRSILEIVVEQLKRSGIADITLCVGYLSHLIRAVFDNSASGARVNYVHEPQPLGTVGPLRLIDGLDRTFVVLNGDVLTDLRYEDLLAYHGESGNAITIAAHKRVLKIDYGVIHVGAETHPRVVEYEEKPELALMVSMGIYVLEPTVVEHVPEDQYFDFPDLVRKLLGLGLPVGTYLHDGLWFDIGRREDYEQATAVWLEGEPDAELPALAGESPESSR
jgi:NDP-sugar pyrophosphorylase family protein